MKGHRPSDGPALLREEAGAHHGKCLWRGDTGDENDSQEGGRLHSESLRAQPRLFCAIWGRERERPREGLWYMDDGAA